MTLTTPDNPDDPAVYEHLRARSAAGWVDALCTGGLQVVRAALADRPGRANQFLTQPRPWGEEMWMPMHFAADAGQLAVVVLLSEQGVSRMCRTRFATPMHARATPLHLASAGGHEKIVALLLAPGTPTKSNPGTNTDPDVLDARQDRPLHLAARFGHASVVAQLLAAGAEPDPRNANGRTPLHEAIRSADAVDDAAANAAALALIRGRADVSADCPKEPLCRTPLLRCESLGKKRAAVTDALRHALQA